MKIEQLLQAEAGALADIISSKDYKKDAQDFIAAVDAFHRNQEAQDILFDMKEYSEDFADTLKAINKDPELGLKVLKNPDVISAHNSGDGWLVNTLYMVDEWLQLN